MRRGNNFVPVKQHSKAENVTFGLQVRKVNLKAFQNHCGIGQEKVSKRANCISLHANLIKSNNNFTNATAPLLKAIILRTYL